MLTLIRFLRFLEWRALLLIQESELRLQHGSFPLEQSRFVFFVNYLPPESPLADVPCILPHVAVRSDISVWRSFPPSAGTSLLNWIFFSFSPNLPPDPVRRVSLSRLSGSHFMLASKRSVFPLWLLIFSPPWSAFNECNLEIRFALDEVFRCVSNHVFSFLRNDNETFSCPADEMAN